MNYRISIISLLFWVSIPNPVDIDTRYLKIELIDTNQRYFEEVLNRYRYRYSYRRYKYLDRVGFGGVSVRGLGSGRSKEFGGRGWSWGGRSLGRGVELGSGRS